MATVSERIELLIDAKAGGAITEMRKLSAATDSAAKSQTQATGVTGMFERGLGKLGVTSEAAGAVMKGALAAGAVAAGYAMVQFGQQAVGAYVNLADKVRLVNEAMGGTVEQSSRLVAITDDYGISAETTAKSMAFMGRAVKANADDLEALGVKVARTRDGNVDMQRTLENVAEAYRTTEDPAKRSQLIMEAFGRTGRDLIPILEQGRDGIREMYGAVPDKQILSDEDLQAAREYQLAVDDLNDAMQELKIMVGQGVVPTLAEMATGLANVIRLAQKLEGVLQQITPGGSSPFSSLNDGLVQLIPGVGNAYNAVKALNKITGDAKQSSDDLGVSAGELAARYSETTSQANGLIDATLALANAHLGTEGAVLNVERNLNTYNEKLAETGAESLETREAQNRLEASVLGVASAAITQAEQQAILEGRTLSAAEKVAIQQQELEALRAKFPELGPVIDDYINKLYSIPTVISTLIEARVRVAEAVVGSVTDWIEGKAVGGPVMAGTPYIVGEEGPELFVPGASGTIVPNGAMTSGAGGGAGTLVFPISIGGRQVAEVVVSELNRAGGPKISSKAVV